MKTDKYKDYQSIGDIHSHIKRYPNLMLGCRYVITPTNIRVHKDDIETIQDRFLKIILEEMKEIINRPIKD